MKKFILIIFILINNTVYAQSDNFGISVSTNLFKPFLGLISFDIEVSVSNHLAIHLYLEKKYSEKIDHPDIVGKIGTRYYFSNSQNIQSKIFIGINTTLAISDNDSDKDGFSFGNEIGYKYMISEKLFVAPMIVSHFLLVNKKLLMGFEAPFGWRF